MYFAGNFKVGAKTGGVLVCIYKEISRSEVEKGSEKYMGWRILTRLTGCLGGVGV